MDQLVPQVRVLLYGFLQPVPDFLELQQHLPFTIFYLLDFLLEVFVFVFQFLVQGLVGLIQLLEVAELFGSVLQNRFVELPDIRDNVAVLNLCFCNQLLLGVYFVGHFQYLWRIVERGLNLNRIHSQARSLGLKARLHLFLALVWLENHRLDLGGMSQIAWARFILDLTLCQLHVAEGIFQ